MKRKGASNIVTTVILLAVAVAVAGAVAWWIGFANGVEVESVEDNDVIIIRLGEIYKVGQYRYIQYGGYTGNTYILWYIDYHSRTSVSTRIFIYHGYIIDVWGTDYLIVDISTGEVHIQKVGG